MASPKTWKFCDLFLQFFFGKTTPYSKLFKSSVPNVYTVTPIDAAVCKCRNTSDGKSCIIYLTKKQISAAFQTVGTVQIAPKYARTSPLQWAHSAPDFIQIGSVTTEF